MRLRSPAPRPLRGRVTVPGDKSITHRALWCGALASGRTRIENPNPGLDCRALIAVLRHLGCAVEEGDNAAGPPTWSVSGRPGSFQAPSAPLDFANSGTAARLALGALAGAGLSATLDGDASLRRRPMRRVVEPLREMGARIEGDVSADHLPLRLEPATLTGRAHRTAIASAQVKTALLFAGLAASGRTQVTEPAPSRDHTERMLPLFGVRLESGSPIAGEEHTVALEGGQRLEAAHLAVPGDFSAAAFWLVAATLVPDSELVLPQVSLNPLRSGLLPVLERMGARVRATAEGNAAGDPIGTLVVTHAPLRSTVIRAEEIPSLLDEIPVWAVAAASAEGRSEVRGAADLRTKESDRLARLCAGLRALGAVVEELPDGLVIEGTAGRPLVGGRLETAGDHRLAMAFLVAGLAASDPVEVTAGEMVDTSDPAFYSSLLNLVSPR